MVDRNLLPFSLPVQAANRVMPINNAKTVTGIQFGLINLAGQLDDGLQIGLINVVDHGNAFPFMPIVNWSF